MASRLVCVADYENYAEKHLPKGIRDYFNGGANYEETRMDNTEAFKRYRFKPRYMCDVSSRDLSTTLLGEKVNYPVGVSPMSACRIAHPDGEVAVAKACQTEGVCFGLSMAATSSMEEIAQAAPRVPRWFHVQILRERDMVKRMVARAERAGFKALALTVDCAVHGRRNRDLRNQFALPSTCTLKNFEEDFKQGKSVFSDATTKQEWGNFANDILDPSHSWKDIQWLKSVSPLPVVVKGVMTGHDAELAIKHGADAIWVSNHGGRELDCLPATIDALGEVCQAVGGRAEVYLDGGVRSGLDVLKALSRGARAVFVGRPALWGLASNGEEGARRVLNIMKDELSIGMALTGVTDAKNVPKDIVVPHSSYSRL